MSKIQKDRIVALRCKYCKKDSEYRVGWGEFIRLEVGISCELLKERPGLTDKLIMDVVCEECGCVSGLDFKNK